MRATKKLKDIATQAGRWLGLAAPAPTHTQAIRFDRFDTMAWRDTYQQAGAVRQLAGDLRDQHSYVENLLQDVFTGAYKALPELQDRSLMDPTRAVNHQIMSALMDSPEFEQLRRDTVGDQYAAAMAVLSQGEQLRGMLDKAREAQNAAQAAAEARRQATQAAQDVQAALDAAAGDEGADGNVGDDAAQRVADAVAAAEAADQAAQAADQAAEQALAQASPGIRTAARSAAAKSAEQAREEAGRAAAWGVDKGQLERMSFADRAALAERLAGNRLAQFAALIGRFRAMAAGERSRRFNPTGGELVGVTLGDDLSRLVPSELAALAVPAMRADVVARLAEGRLMQYESADEEPSGFGPIIAVVDCSGSMTHEEDGGITREAWAKACALALLDQARASKRWFVGILFSSSGQQKVFEFAPGPIDITQVLDFAETFFGNGTDFMEPLGLASDLMAESWDVDDVRHGDVVLITDGDARVTDPWLEGWRKRKDVIGYRLFGVAVAHQPGAVLEVLCDNLRSVTDLADLDAPRDMFRLI